MRKPLTEPPGNASSEDWLQYVAELAERLVGALKVLRHRTKREGRWLRASPLLDPSMRCLVNASTARAALLRALPPKPKPSEPSLPVDAHLKALG